MIISTDDKLCRFALSNFRGAILSSGSENHLLIYRRCHGLPGRCRYLHKDTLGQCHRSTIYRNHDRSCSAVVCNSRGHLDSRLCSYSRAVFRIQSDGSGDFLPAVCRKFQRSHIIVAHSNIDINHTAARLKCKLAT